MKLLVQSWAAAQLAAKNKQNQELFVFMSELLHSNMKMVNLLQAATISSGGNEQLKTNLLVWNILTWTRLQPEQITPQRTNRPDCKLPPTIHMARWKYRHSMCCWQWACSWVEGPQECKANCVSAWNTDALMTTWTVRVSQRPCCSATSDALPVLLLITLEGPD